MRCSTTVVIDSPVRAVERVLADPTLSTEWMDDLTVYEQLTGVPGAVGAVARMTFGAGRRAMTFTMTIVASDLPNEVRTVLDSTFARVETRGMLAVLSVQQTQYTFEQTFAFKGPVHALLGMLGKATIRRQQQRHAEGLKRFVEAAPVSKG